MEWNKSTFNFSDNPDTVTTELHAKNNHSHNASHHCECVAIFAVNARVPRDFDLPIVWAQKENVSKSTGLSTKDFYVKPSFIKDQKERERGREKKEKVSSFLGQIYYQTDKSHHAMVMGPFFSD